MYYDTRYRTIQYRFARLDALVAVRFTTNLSEFTDEAGTALGGGKMIINGVWSLTSGLKCRYIDFLAMSNQIADLEARIAALETPAA